MVAGADWAAAAVSLLGAGLAYVGARRGSRPERDAVVESRRDEWGRRFAQAIDLMGSATPAQRAIGRALFDALLDSDLAGPDDRRIAARLVQSGVLEALPPGLRLPVSGVVAHVVDDVRFVEDDDAVDTASTEVKVPGVKEHS